MEGISELEADKQLVILSADLKDAEGNICHHHLQFYLVRLESFQRVCCDPFNHKKPIKGRLRNITMHFREQCKGLLLDLTSGEKMFRNSSKVISGMLQGSESDNQPNDNEADEDINS